MNYLQRIDESLRKWNTGEGVKAIMTLEQEILIKEARAKRKGREEGAQETLAKLVKQGLLSKEVAAAQAGISIEEFHRLMETIS